MLLTLLLLLHESLLSCLVFLIPNHLLHTLGFQLLSPLLNADHFLVLLALLFEPFCLTIVAFGLAHLLASDCLFLLHTDVLVSDHQLSLILLSLLRKSHLLVKRFGVSLSHVNNVVSLLFSFFNFFPGLNVMV